MTAASPRPAPVKPPPRIVEGRLGLAALGGLYAASWGRLRVSGSLRRSLLGWTVAGLVLSAGLGVAIGALVSLRTAAWAAPGAVLWVTVVAAVLLGGAEMLVTPDGRHIERYGAPNGLTALRACSCWPLILCATLPLSGDTGLYLWCAIGLPAGLLDTADGWIARRFGPLTQLGAALDPLGDAVFFSVAAVGNVLVGILPAWLGGVVLVRYAAPLVLTPVVFLMRRRPELVHTRWGRWNTALTGGVIVVCAAFRLLGGPVQVPAIVLGIPLLVTTTLLHFATLWRRVVEAPLVRPSRREQRSG